MPIKTRETLLGTEKPEASSLLCGLTAMLQLLLGACSISLQQEHFDQVSDVACPPSLVGKEPSEAADLSSRPGNPQFQRMKKTSDFEILNVCVRNRGKNHGHCSLQTQVTLIT